MSWFRNRERSVEELGGWPSSNHCWLFQHNPVIKKIKALKIPTQLVFDPEISSDVVELPALIGKLWSMARDGDEFLDLCGRSPDEMQAWLVAQRLLEVV